MRARYAHAAGLIIAIGIFLRIERNAMIIYDAVYNDEKLIDHNRPENPVNLLACDLTREECG